MSARISIIIANYNNGCYFKDCYESLIAQTSKDWEAIIIDDASEDDSVAVIEAFIKGDKRFRLYRNEENVGYSKSLQNAISFSQAELFARLDPDDALSPEAIEKSLSVHKQYPEVSLTYTNLQICDSDLIPQRVEIKQQLSRDTLYFALRWEISHFAVFKRKIYDQTSGVDVYNALAQDTDMYFKMWEIAPVRHIPHTSYYYRQHARGISRSPAMYLFLWMAIIKAFERRNSDKKTIAHITAEFLKIIPDPNLSKLERLKRAKWVKLGHKLGLLKCYKHL